MRLHTIVMALAALATLAGLATGCAGRTAASGGSEGGPIDGGEDGASAEDSTTAARDGRSEDGPSESEERVGMSSGEVDATGDVAGGPAVLMLGDGLFGDGSCPGSLTYGFAAGTETCASDRSAHDAGSFIVCLPSDPDAGITCPFIDAQWMIACNTSSAPVPSCDTAHFRLGSYDCVEDTDFYPVLPLYPPPPGDAGVCCVEEEAGAFTTFAYGAVLDTDHDFVPDLVDNCPRTPNLDQGDTDCDGVGDACDNCPYTFNPGQDAQLEGGVGNACNCALPGVVLGPDGCPCAGDSGTTDAEGGVCGRVVMPEGGGESTGDKWTSFLCFTPCELHVRVPQRHR
jgi:hypothetical protein